MRLNLCVSRVCPIVSGVVVVRIAAWEIAIVQACYMERQFSSVADPGVARKTFEKRCGVRSDAGACVADTRSHRW